MHGSQVCYVSVPKEEQRCDATGEQHTTRTNSFYLVGTYVLNNRTLSVIFKFYVYIYYY